MRPKVMWDAMLFPKLQVGASKVKSMGSVVGANVLPGTRTLILQRSSSGKVAVKVPVKLGSLMFRYFMTSFKCRAKGVSSFG